MKKTLLLFLVITVLSHISSCTKEDEPNEIFSIVQKELIFEAAGEKTDIIIQSNTKWEFDQVRESWCKVTPMSGDGDMTVSVEVTENNTESTRNTTLIARTKNKTHTIKIIQESAKIIIEPEEYYLPLLTINTENAKPIESKDEYVNATITLEVRDKKGVITEKLLEASTEIKGRGNSTWGMEKKPYRLKLKESTSILDMPKSKHWVLLANYSDKTLMRNELAFEISRRMEFAYTPRMQYVDVILNGDYVGNYMLGEHIRIDKNRVNVVELGASDEDISGGYLLEIDERTTKEDPQGFMTNKAGMTFSISRPEDIPANQKEYISDYIQNLEDVFYSKDDIDPIEELPKILDLKSFIDYFLLNELSKNVDGNLRLSTYVYKNRGDDKLYFGPVWDYDIAFGNVDYSGCEQTHGWYARTAAWYQQFFSHSEFETMVKERWKELRNGVLADLDPFIDETAEKLNMSQKKNFERWQILNIQVWPNPIVTGSYNGEINYLKTWLSNRLKWMDNELM